MDERGIGVFDSGLGGLTVLEAMADLLPAENLVYLGDTARYPYGSRSVDELVSWSRQIVDLLLERDVKLVVVACNSATAAALDVLRDEYDIPIIGVVGPGVRAARKTTRSGRVGVIGTQMTMQSRIYERTSAALRTGLHLTVMACPSFVDLVESGDVDSDHARAVVARELAPMRARSIDTLVLGCTHFPLLARAIKDEVGPDVTLVSSADETAFEVREILDRTGWRRRAGSTRSLTLLTSGDPERFRALGERFLLQPLPPVEHVDWR